MEDPGFRIVLALVVVVAAAVALTLIVTAITRPGPRRAGLIAAGLPLALLLPVIAAAYAAGRIRGYFGGMAHPDGTAQFVALCESLWQLQRVAWGALAAVCVLGFVLGLARPGPPAAGVAGSTRRALVLLALPLLALLVAGALTREVGRVLRVATAMMSSVPDDPDSRRRADAALEAAGLPTQGRGSLARVGYYLDRASLAGMFGGATAGVILLGLAATGTILAWRVGFATPFRLVASALWLLAAAVGTVLAAGRLDPLRFQ